MTSIRQHRADTCRVVSLPLFYLADPRQDVQGLRGNHAVGTRPVLSLLPVGSCHTSAIRRDTPMQSPDSRHLLPSDIAGALVSTLRD
jgi:hypothetical protein